jgi:hypothetical protein
MNDPGDARARRPGVHYARTDDGIDLPVVDVTHPAFALDVTADEQRELVARFLAEPQPLARMPAFLRDALLRVLLRKAALARAIGEARGGYLRAIPTYLLKLGPDNLVAGYASPVDRRIAASLPALAMRLRLQDMARLLADALAPRLAEADVSPVRLINIAGGTAIDSINALLLLRQRGVLGRRRVRIDVLDLDAAGPAFGARALEALRTPGAPLEGVDAALGHTRYDWNDVSVLRAALRDGEGGHASAGSSEGGLFEYGSDEAILANLVCLREEAPRDFVFVASVTRADEPTERVYRWSRAATRQRGLDALRALAGRAGWQVTRAIERPFSDQVTLVARDR